MSVQSKNDRAAWLQGPSAECLEIGPGTAQPWKLVLLGAPGVGKGTQADLLRQRLGACHLSTGDVFRAAASRTDCKPSPAMEAALGYMCRGELVPDETVWEMVRERSACLRCRGGFLLDGFPRTLGQAEALRLHMKAEGIALNAVINYELPLAEIVERLSGRRVCEKCKAVFHATRQPPKRPGVCDHCSGRLYQREDDRAEAVQVRMDVYERSTAPLIEFYRKHELLLPVSAHGTPGEICARTLTALVTRGSKRVESLV